MCWIVTVVVVASVVVVMSKSGVEERVGGKPCVDRAGGVDVLHEYRPGEEVRFVNARVTLLVGIVTAV